MTLTLKYVLLEDVKYWQKGENAIVLTGHVLRKLNLSNMTHHRPLARGKYYALISSALWRKNGYYHLYLGLF